jgi:hypothetical protein
MTTANINDEIRISSSLQEIKYKSSEQVGVYLKYNLKITPYVFIIQLYTEAIK